MPIQNETMLLHCCCAPCTIMPLSELLAPHENSKSENNKQKQLALYYSNSNIHPASEYEKRLQTLRSYLKPFEVELLVDTYNPDVWEEEVGIFGGPYPLIEEDEKYQQNLAQREKRCGACYELRFKKLCSKARELAYGCVDSTLTISPYQFTQIIHDKLESCAAEQELQAKKSDWRPLYNEATRISRELGMYRQNYCGCRYSEQEAQMEKEARKKQRAAKKQQQDSFGAAQ